MDKQSYEKLGEFMAEFEAAIAKVVESNSALQPTEKAGG